MVFLDELSCDGDEYNHEQGREKHIQELGRQVLLEQDMLHGDESREAAKHERVHDLVFPDIFKEPAPRIIKNDQGNDGEIRG